jgi:hypothetical protein
MGIFFSHPSRAATHFQYNLHVQTRISIEGSS